jgi:hypothetical protein
VCAKHYSRLTAPAGTSKGFPKEALKVSPKLPGLSFHYRHFLRQTFPGSDFFGGAGLASLGALHRERVCCRENRCRLEPHRAGNAR